MASLLECSAECEKYFIDNWTATQINIPDRPFTYDGINSYISINYYPLLNTMTGGLNGGTSCRIRAEGLVSIRCYDKTQKLSLKLADDVKTFFNNQELPKNINIGIGVDSPVIKIDSGWYEAKVSFELIQD